MNAFQNMYGILQFKYALMMIHVNAFCLSFSLCMLLANVIYTNLCWDGKNIVVYTEKNYQSCALLIMKFPLHVCCG